MRSAPQASRRGAFLRLPRGRGKAAGVVHGRGRGYMPAMEETHLTQLGRDVRGFASPEEAVLERVPNPHPDTLYLARFTAPEFTSLCPVTGQPDFAHLVID